MLLALRMERGDMDEGIQVTSIDPDGQRKASAPRALGKDYSPPAAVPTRLVPDF